MKELENHHNQEIVKYDKTAKLQCNCYIYQSYYEFLESLEHHLHVKGDEN